MGLSIFLTLPVQLAEAESKWGGAVSPAITCVGAESIYVYEVIYDSSDEG